MGRHVQEDDLKTINGESIVGEGDLKISTVSYGVPPMTSVGGGVQMLIDDLFYKVSFDAIKSGDSFYIRRAVGEVKVIEVSIT